jgi:hypothetical protein
MPAEIELKALTLFDENDKNDEEQGDSDSSS